MPIEVNTRADAQAHAAPGAVIVTHQLFFARRTDADAAAAAAALLPGTVSVRAYGDGWRLDVSHAALAMPAATATSSRRLTAIAKRHFGEYGGWCGSLTCNASSSVP